MTRKKKRATVCPKCGTPNNGKQRSCPKCGRKLS